MPKNIRDVLEKPKKKPIYRELRCTACRLLICHEYITNGYILYKCTRCGELNRFEFTYRFNAKPTDK